MEGICNDDYMIDISDTNCLVNTTSNGEQFSFSSCNIVSQTSFSLYLHNQWTDFHKLSCAGKPQMKAIHIYVGGTRVTTNDWDIRPSVAVKVLLANILWTAKRIDEHFPIQV